MEEAGDNARGGGRRAVTLWVIGVLALASVAAATGLGGPVPALAFKQSGHWVYNHTLGAVFHVNGASKDVDATAAVPRAGQGSQVLQGDTQGFVVDRTNGRVIVFGKSTLTVQSRLPIATTEEPIGLEVRGGPYLVYQRGGKVIRLGQPPVTIDAGGPLGNPVTTTDGTVWVQRIDTGSLCSLPRAHDRLSCRVSAPADHAGALTAIDDRPAYVDTVADTVAPITRDGLGQATPLGTDVPANAQVAGTDAGGRLPILSPGAGPGQGSTLLLVDTSTVGTGKPGVGPIKVPLGTGRFGAPATSGGAVAVVDRTAGKVVTFNNQGVRKATRSVPAGSGQVRLSRGEDGRVYADDADGAHTMVVDGDGSVTSVKVGGQDVPSGTPPSSAPPSGGDPPATSPDPTTVPAAAPGAPRRVSAVPGDGQARVTWSPAVANGAAITGYRVVWRAVSGDARSGSVNATAQELDVTVTGLVNGVTYVVTVAAQNRIGTGPGADSAAFTPGGQTAPSGVRAVANQDGTVSVSWQAGGGGGRYSVVARSTSDTRTVAQTSRTRVVASGLTLDVPWRFSITAAGSGSSATSETVTPFRAAAPPGQLTAKRGKAAVDLSWTAPALNGSRFTGYRVTASGQPTRMVTTTSTRFTGLSNGTVYQFTVRAVTADPNTGAGIDGALASISATPATVPTVTIGAARWVGRGRAAIRVTVDDGGNAPVTCNVFVNLVLGPLSRRCAGTDELVITGLKDDSDYAFQVSGTNAVGKGPTTKLFVLRAHATDEPHIDIYRGAGAGGGSAFVHVAMFGMAPNSTYTMTCHSSSAPAGFANYSDQTDDLGYLQGEECRYGRPGDEVWVTAVRGNLVSNRIQW